MPHAEGHLSLLEILQGAFPSQTGGPTPVPVAPAGPTTITQAPSGPAPVAIPSVPAVQSISQGQTFAPPSANPFQNLLASLPELLANFGGGAATTNSASTLAQSFATGSQEPATTDVGDFRSPGLDSLRSTIPSEILPPKKPASFESIDEANFGQVSGELKSLDTELRILVVQEPPDIDRMRAVSRRIGDLETIFDALKTGISDVKEKGRLDEERTFRAGITKAANERADALAGEADLRQDARDQQSQQFGLLSLLLPLLMRQQQQGGQFAQTQGLAEQRFAAEREQASQFATERSQQEQQAQAQRQQAAALIPQLFPDMPIGEDVLSGGIDPSLIPVLIQLAQLRSQQNQQQNQVGTLPTVAFAR